jgi:hypothetical protein
MEYRLLIIPILLIIIDLFFGFQIYSSDTLGLIAISKELDLNEISTYSNGVYPPGFVLLIAIILKTNLNLLFTLKTLNYLFLTLFLLTTYIGLKRYVRLIPFVISIIAAVFLSKLFLINILSAGSYPLYLFLGAFGIIYFYNEQNKYFRLSLVSLVFCTVVRNEGIILIISILISVAPFKSSKRRILGISLALIASLFILFLSNYLGIGSVLSNKHNLLFEEPNWVNMHPEFIFNRFTFKEFFEFYFSNLFIDWYYFICLALCALYFKELRMLIFGLLIFYLLIKIHPSPRGIFILIPFSFLFLGIAIYDQKRIQKILLLLIISPVFTFYSLNNYYSIRRKQIDIQTYELIGKYIEKIQLNWEIQNLFTNNFDFYLRKKLPKTARVNGGWPKLIPRYYQNNPNLTLTNLIEFSRDIDSLKIEYIVIDLSMLDLSIYTQEEINTFSSLDRSDQFLLISEFESRYKLYRYSGNKQKHTLNNGIISSSENIR